MPLHVHRNSFNAGEISPLMDARVDDAKHSFSCRKLENFIPRIYGGAFRRPGMMHLGEVRNVAVWEEVKSTFWNYFGGTADAPTASDDNYELGAIWIRDVRTVYKCSDATPLSAVWNLVSANNDLYAFSYPTADDDTGDSYESGSVWFHFSSQGLWECSDATASAAVWNLKNTLLNNLTATSAPGTGDDSDYGYAVGSFWVRHQYTVYRCTDNTPDAAVWDTVSQQCKPVSDRAPTGSDGTGDGYAVGSAWVNNIPFKAYTLTDASSSEPARLIDWNLSADVRYVLELGSGYCRFWTDDGEAVDFGSGPVTVDTPYVGDDVYQLQVARLGKTAYFSHPDYPPQKLTAQFFSGVADFTWSEVEWDFPAFRDINNSDVTATPTHTSGNTRRIKLSGNPFTEAANPPDYVGARIALTQRRAAAHTSLALTATASSTAISVLGEYQVYTYGTFVGSMRVQGKNAAGTWETLRSFAFNGETDGRQIVYSSSVDTTTEIRLDVTYVSGSGGMAYLEVGDSRRTGYARITNILQELDGPLVDVDIEVEFDSTDATTEWAIESWGQYAGYPRSVCFHEQRLWFGGTRLEPNTFWASAVNDFANFRRGAFDSDSLAFTLSADEDSAIQSMVSHEALVIYTQSEEWTATTSEQTAITPSNIFVRRQSRFGSAHRQSFIAANNLIFLQRGERKVRQFVYGGGGQGQASDLTLLAEHVTKSGIRQLAFQQQPDPVIWAVTNAGVLLSLTYEPDQNVTAWARHLTDGTVESVAAIFGDSDESDQVWLSVLRNGTRRIERLDPDAIARLEDDEEEKMVYLDAAIRVENETASTAVSGLSHLEGETVAILADGAVVPSKVVASGAITLDDAAETVVVGLPYDSYLQPSKVEIPSDNGTSQGKTFVCKRVTLNLWKSQGMQYADDPDEDDDANWFNVLGRSTDTPLGDPEPLFTGLVEIVNQGSYRDNVDFTIRQSLPLPCNVLATIPQINISPD